MRGNLKKALVGAVIGVFAAVGLCVAGLVVTLIATLLFDFSVEAVLGGAAVLAFCAVPILTSLMSKTAQ